MDAQSYQISPVDLKKRQDDGEPLVLLDVREPGEFQFAHIPNSILIPLGQLAARLDALDPEDEIVTLCHHGIRSMSALGILVQRGFSNVKHLTGGIDAYSQLADPTIPRYR